MSDVKHTGESLDSKPSVEPNWRRIYWGVAGFFVIEVGLFYLFTQYYR